ncbi:MAG: membrane protein insertase YidC [bacterium]
MDDRVLLAIFLSILIIITYQYFFMPRPVVQKKPLGEKEEIVIEEKGLGDSEFQDEGLNGLIEIQKARKQENVRIETGKYIAEVTNNGGCLKSWKLKEYTQEKRYETWPLKKAFWIQVLQSYKRVLGLKHDDVENEVRGLVELIPENDKGIKTLPLDITLISEIGGKEVFGEGFYEIRTDEYIDANKGIQPSVILSYLDDRGILIGKEIRFFENEYKLGIDITMKNISGRDQAVDYALCWGPGIGRNMEQEGHHRFEGPVFWINGKKVRIKPKKIKEPVIKEGSLEWVGYEKTYFGAAIIPENTSAEAVVFRRGAAEGEEDAIIVGAKYPLRVITAGGQIRDSYEVYIGPKRKEDLIGVAGHFVEIIDYGWFSFLAKPLIWFLKWVYRYIPNYGIAIVLLTIIIKILFWPLTEKSFGSMQAMQKIQPKMAALREKYKGDPTRMNKEIMDLYKKHGVNPLGGCLPMILQIPVFFALYEGLLVAIEMRGAPFFLWIQDLSAMDPLLITPVLMGITMYMQQKMMPTGMDPKQAKMMNLMPIIFTVFFLGFPSGLVIYWLLNNVLTIGHQYLIHKRTLQASEAC